LHDYLIQFELVATMNEWNNDMKALQLATSLRDSAQGVLADLEEEERRDYQTLVDALTLRFEPPNSAEMYRAELKCRSRQAGEKLCDLAQDIKRLVRRAHRDDPKSTRDRLARDSFLDALNDADMEWSVFKQKPTTVDEALQYAIEYEAFQKGRNRRTGDRRGLRMQSFSNSTGAVPEAMPQTIQGGTNDNASRKLCFFCNAPGHFKRECQKYAAWIQVHPSSSAGPENYPQLPL
jgi:hypothetical protein